MSAQKHFYETGLAHQPVADNFIFTAKKCLLVLIASVHIQTTHPYVWEEKREGKRSDQNYDVLTL